MSNGKIKVVWFSNCILGDGNSRGSGSWLYAMRDLLSADIELINITKHAGKTIEHKIYNDIEEYLLPNYKLYNGLPSKANIKQITDVVAHVKPDIIHIWGTETYWGMLTARGYIKGNIILEIQGLLFQIHKYYYNTLTLKDLIRCFRLKEFLKPSTSLVAQKYMMKKRGEFELEMIKNHKLISTQSDWVRANVGYANPDAKILSTKIPLRKEFNDRKSWDSRNIVKHQIFTSSSSVTSYKGLHVLIDAIGLLKHKYPSIKIVVAGHKSEGIRRDGYTKWLLDKIKKMGMENNVIWLGSLNANELVDVIKASNVAVIPSFIESYCLALAESLAVGIPTVASYAGAMPKLSTPEDYALYFSPGDAAMCAKAIESIFEDEQIANKQSTKSNENIESLNNESVAKLQLDIYKEVLNQTK